MIYSLVDQRRRVDINIEQIVSVERLKNPDTVADERVLVELTGDIKFRFTGLQAKNFFQDYRNLIVPALGGLLNTPP